jgi:serralysin
VAGHPLSGTVTLSEVATGTAVERDGSPASPAQTSVRRVEIPLAADGLAEAPERLRVILTEVASSAPGVSAVLGTKEAVATVADGDAVVAVSRGGVGLLEKPSIYSGPVDYLDYEFLGTEGAENAVGTAFNDFVNLLGGVDAADGGAGDDVLDGGTGSNFLTGGAGRDVFFLDGRGGQVSWSTITDWQAGEQLSVWGWQPGVSKALWLDSDGTPGFTGVTMHGDLDGNGTIDTSVTWSGRARADLPDPLAFDGLLWFT